MAGLVTKTKYNKFQVYFYNELTGKQMSIGNYDTEEEAINKVNEIEVSFYSQNRHLLPKGVNVIGMSFILQIRTNTIRRGSCTLNVGSTKTLRDMKKLKVKVMTSLMG